MKRRKKGREGGREREEETYVVAKKGRKEE